MSAPSITRSYVTVNDAAEALGVSTRTIREFIARGTLTGYRLGTRMIRIDADELNALLKPIPSAQAGGAK